MRISKVIVKSQILSFDLKHLRSVLAHWLVWTNILLVIFFFSETTFMITGSEHLSKSETKELFKFSY